MNFDFKPMDLRSALSIVEWEYPPPYEEYNLYGSPLALLRMLEGEYFAAFAGEVLMGFICLEVLHSSWRSRTMTSIRNPIWISAWACTPVVFQRAGDSFVGRAWSLPGSSGQVVSGSQWPPRIFGHECTPAWVSGRWGGSMRFSGNDSR